MWILTCAHPNDYEICPTCDRTHTRSSIRETKWKRAFFGVTIKEHYHTWNIGIHFLKIFHQQTRQTRMKIYGIPLLFMQETKWKSYEMIDVNEYSLMRLIYPLLLGLQALLFKKKFPAETKTWLTSSHLYHKCAYTALKLREKMLKLPDASYTQCKNGHISFIFFCL